MSLHPVELGKKGRQGGHAEDYMAAGFSELRKPPQRKPIIIDVLDHIEGQDDIVFRRSGRQIFGQISFYQRTIGTVQPHQRIPRNVEARYGVSEFFERTKIGAPTAADLDDPTRSLTRDAAQQAQE
jgi:hypothetical protein